MGSGKFWVPEGGVVNVGAAFGVHVRALPCEMTLNDPKPKP